MENKVYIGVIKGYAEPTRLFLCQRICIVPRTNGVLRDMLCESYPDFINFREKQLNHQFKGTDEWRFCTNCFKGPEDLEAGQLFVTASIPDDLEIGKFYSLDDVNKEDTGLVCEYCFGFRASKVITPDRKYKIVRCFDRAYPGLVVLPQ